MIENKKADEAIFVRFSIHLLSTYLALSSSAAIPTATVSTAIAAASATAAITAATGFTRTIFFARFCSCPAFEYSLT
jgi:hypothetical protein